MKNFRFVTVCVFLLISVSLYPQSPAYVMGERPIRNFNLTALGIASSYSLIRETRGSVEDFRNRYGNKNSMLNAGPEGYTESAFPFNYQSNAAIQIDFSLPGTKGRNGFISQTLRSEISYSACELRAVHMYRDLYIPGNDFIQNGVAVSADTVETNSFLFSEKTEFIFLRTAFLFRSPSAKRFQFSAGFGIEAGGAFLHSGFHSRYSQTRYVLYKDPNGNTVSNQDLGHVSREEYTPVNPFFHAGVFFPATVELVPFLKKTGLNCFSVFLQGTYGLGVLRGNDSHSAREHYGLGCGIRYRVSGHE